MLAEIVRFLIDILDDVFLCYRFVDLEVLIFKHVDLSLLVTIVKDVAYKVKLLEMKARKLILTIKETLIREIIDQVSLRYFV